MPEPVRLRGLALVNNIVPAGFASTTTNLSQWFADLKEKVHMENIFSHIERSVDVT